MSAIRRFLSSLFGSASNAETERAEERRTGGDRRSGEDRRAPRSEHLDIERRSGTDRRAGGDRRSP